MFHGNKALLYRSTLDSNNSSNDEILQFAAFEVIDANQQLQGKAFSFEQEQHGAIKNSENLSPPTRNPASTSKKVYLPVTFHPAELLSSFRGTDLEHDPLLIDPGFIFLGLLPSRCLNDNTNVDNDGENNSSGGNNGTEQESSMNATSPPPVFAVSISTLTTTIPGTNAATLSLFEDQNENNNTATALPQNCLWLDIRSAGPHLSSGDAALLANAAGLLAWHKSAAFCARSGKPAAAEAGGHARRAIININSSKDSSISTTTTKERKAPRAFYPRVDPAVIVAVYTGPWLLLGRKKSWVTGRYSLLAGFTELGKRGFVCCFWVFVCCIIRGALKVYM